MGLLPQVGAPSRVGTAERPEARVRRPRPGTPWGRVRIVYLQYGSDVALTMRLEDGSLRVVPSRAIIYLDILDSKEEKDDRPKENGVYFG